MVPLSLDCKFDFYVFNLWKGALLSEGIGWNNSGLWEYVVFNTIPVREEQNLE